MRAPAIGLVIAVFVCGCSADCSAAEADFLSVIHSRKSVRQYTGQRVSKEDLLTLVKAGMAAPSARDRRPWQFIVVTDEDTLARLAEGLPYTKMILRSKSCIIVCGDMDKALKGEEEQFWVQDCSAATENILLAAEAMGLGAVWSGMYPLKERMAHVRKVLGMPESVIPLNVIAVGYPTGEEKPKDKFDGQRVHWGKW